MVASSSIRLIVLPRATAGLQKRRRTGGCASPKQAPAAGGPARLTRSPSVFSVDSVLTSSGCSTAPSERSSWGHSSVVVAKHPDELLGGSGVSQAWY